MKAQAVFMNGNRLFVNITLKFRARNRIGRCLNRKRATKLAIPCNDVRTVRCMDEVLGFPITLNTSNIRYFVVG